MHKFRDHPLFCKVYAYSLNPTAMVMRFYEMGDLGAYIIGEGAAVKSFPYTKLRVLELTTKLCAAVAHMHESGIVHCDMKPGNVFLEPRLIGDRKTVIPILTDFGISQVVSQEALQVEAFVASEIIGATCSYAAPDVWHRFRMRHYAKIL